MIIIQHTLQKNELNLKKDEEKKDGSSLSREKIRILRSFLSIMKAQWLFRAGFKMKMFKDAIGNQVTFSFSKNAFEKEAKHVLVLCQYEEGWLLTNHKTRGLEFPGGKLEQGETLEEAARREVYEETGAILGELHTIGEYKVTDSIGGFVKAVFFGKVIKMDTPNNYHETNGPVTYTGDLLQQRFGQEYSFIMKDQVVEECIKFIQNQNKENSGRII